MGEDVVVLLVDTVLRASVWWYRKGKAYHFLNSRVNRKDGNVSVWAVDNL